MILLYNILVWCLFLALLPLLPLVYAASKKRRANLLPRFGFQKGMPDKAQGEKRIWIHALSVGEVKSAFPFVKAFKKKYPAWKVIFTASTKTGFEIAQKQFVQFGKGRRLIDHLAYYPFDIGFAVRKSLDLFCPDAVVITETDLWPGFLNETLRRNIPIVLINARMSKRSLKGYLLAKRMGLCFFQKMSHIMVQSRLDEKRFEQLGIPSSKISVCGNIKFDRQVTLPDKLFFQEIGQKLSIDDSSKVLLAGSTHDGEEIILLKAYHSLKKKFPGMQLLIAPRDPKRCKQIAGRFESCGVAPLFFSAMDTGIDEAAVVLIDSIGKLAALYAVCDVAFIGGSMVPCGGHNPLEPAAFSKPILFGPDMSDFLEISKMLVEKGGAFEVESGEELGKKVAQLLDNKNLCQEMGGNSQAVFTGNRGAVQRILNIMEKIQIV